MSIQLDEYEALFVSRYGAEAYSLLREQAEAVIAESLFRVCGIGDPVTVVALVERHNEITEQLRAFIQRRSA